MFKKRGALLTFTKLLINNFFIYAIANTGAIIFQSLSNRYLNKNYNIDYNIVSFKYILLLSLILSIMMLGNSKYVTKAIRIDEKSIDVIRIKEAMEKLRWRMKDHAEDVMIFISPLGIQIMRDEICIKFVETEIHITGPNRYVENLIRLAKFPYGSFEIISRE